VSRANFYLNERAGRTAALGKPWCGIGRSGRGPGGAALCKECDAATTNSFTLDTVTKGSLPTFAADAPRQKSVVTLSVCFLRTHPFSLQVQRMSANRPFCRKWKAVAHGPEPTSSNHPGCSGAARRSGRWCMVDAFPAVGGCSVVLIDSN